jgi:hypothetical protein
MSSRQAKSSTFVGNDAASRQSGYLAAGQQQHRPERRVVPMRPRRPEGLLIDLMLSHGFDEAKSVTLAAAYTVALRQSGYVITNPTNRFGRW